MVFQAPQMGNKKKQQGVFTIEFALVASTIALFLMFLSDIVVKENTLGYLQRLSYSGVNVIKERTQLYDKSGDIEPEQVNQLFTLLKNSMQRNMSGFESSLFGMHLEQVVFTDEGCSSDGVCLKTASEPWIRGDNCSPEKSLSSKTELHFKTSWGRDPTFYQVTLCYEGQNWYGELIGEDFSSLRATSVMMGR